MILNTFIATVSHHVAVIVNDIIMGDAHYCWDFYVYLYCDSSTHLLVKIELQPVLTVADSCFLEMSHSWVF